MKRVFETAECEDVRHSIFWVQRYEKHEHPMKGCAVELKLSDWQMNPWTSWACEVCLNTSWDSSGCTATELFAMFESSGDRH